MEFRHWLEGRKAETHDSGARTRIQDFLGWISEAKAERMWVIAFNQVKHDPTGGYIFRVDGSQLGKTHNISEPDEVNVGDLVSDLSMNKTPYWKVTGTDHDTIHLDPIPPNPFVANAEGKVIGAGGHEYRDHDFEVMAGEYEKRRVDGILKKWQAGMVHDVRDVAYLLLGTVPVQNGPNGSQGGWYNVSDHHNRGHMKGMDTPQIVAKDANTIKNVFKLDVPESALTGKIDPNHWNGFIEGGNTGDDRVHTAIPGEEFDNPKALARMVLRHPQPAIKLRNLEALIELYTGHGEFRKQTRSLDGPEDYERATQKWQGGEFTNRGVEPLLKQVIRAVAKMRSVKEYDPYWAVKEKAVVFSGQQKWYDLVGLFAQDGDGNVRLRVFQSYQEAGDAAKMAEMLHRETSAENLRTFLTGNYRVDPKATVEWMRANRTMLNRLSAGDDYHASHLKRTIASLENM